MKLYLAKHSGFCFGVKRAIKLAEETAKELGKAITIGPIIHNPQMVERLQNDGVSAVDDIDLIDSGPVIIRSHGIPIEDLNLLQSKNLKIIDATCPYVNKAHEFIKIADKEGYEIVILGDKTHPEIIALQSYIKSKVYFWEKSQSLPKQKFTKVAIICQTTQNIDNLNMLTSILTPISNELRIFNTICNATIVRQDSSLELAKKCELMIVIGGKNSSNTKMLAKLCSKYAETKHIEVADEINVSWFEHLDDDINIGMTAGASTPDWIIIDIYNKLSKIVGINTSSMYSIDDIPSY